MAKVIITPSLKEQIFKKFKQESIQVLTFLSQLQTNPQKGKKLSHVGGIVIKELKYGSFRFYFITDGHILKFGTDDELAMLIIKFVRMSGKKNQQENINKIKNVLKSLGFKGFD